MSPQMHVYASAYHLYEAAGMLKCLFKIIQSLRTMCNRMFG